MSDPIRLEFLGSGTSHGIPVIGCDCPVCRSDNPKNRRYRPAVIIHWQGKAILIDTPPELRLQLLRAGVTDIDALLYTHAHADHLFGLDDIRIFNQRRHQALPVYGSAPTLASLRQTFAYAFNGASAGGGRPQLEPREIDPIDRPFEVQGLPVQPIPILHGAATVLGYRFGNLAYVTDTNKIPEASLGLLEGLDILILDALRERPHPTHYSVPEALAIVSRLQPAHTYFTHICHDLEHEATSRRLPPGVEVAYDGLILHSPTPARSGG